MIDKPLAESAAAPVHKCSFAADGYCIDCDAKEPSPARNDMQNHRAENESETVVKTAKSRMDTDSYTGPVITARSDRIEVERATIYQVKSFITPGGWIDCTQAAYEDYCKQGYETRMVFADQAGESERPAESAPSGEEIKPWQQRAQEDLGDGWRDFKNGEYKDAEIADLRAALARRATAGTTAPAKPFAGPGAWFSVDVLGNPMRQYAPGKWENCVWPSSVAGTTTAPSSEAKAWGLNGADIADQWRGWSGRLAGTTDPKQTDDNEVKP